MVEFNGVKLTDVAPVEMEDIIVSASPIELTTQNVMLMDGARFVRRRRGIRTVTIPFAVMEQNEQVRRSHIRAITEWATSEGLRKLKISQEKNGYLMAVCTQFPDESSRKHWEIMTLVFTATDPCYIENVVHSQNVTTTVNQLGKEYPMARIEQTVNASLTNATWSCGSEYIKLKNVTPGKLVIDLYAQTITLDGASIMEQMTLDSDFFRMSDKNNKIICTNGAGGTLYFSRRWF